MTDILYFDLFEITPSLKIDTAGLKRVFFLKSREYHPDYFTQSSEEEQERALTMTSLLNQAYTTLGDPVKRLSYFLTSNQVEITGNAQALPQMFLFEMMDLNESIEAVKTREGRDKAKQTIDGLEVQLREGVSSLLEEDDLSTISEDSLESLKIYYLKTKYLVRLRETLDRIDI